MHPFCWITVICCLTHIILANFSSSSRFDGLLPLTLVFNTPQFSVIFKTGVCAGESIMFTYSYWKTKWQPRSSFSADCLRFSYSVLSRKTLYKKQSVSSPLRVSLWGWCFWVVRLFNHKQDVLLVYIIFLQVVLEFSLGLRVKSFTCILAAVQGTLDTLLTSFLWISLPTSTRLVLYRVPLFGLSLVTPVFDTWKHHVYRSRF